MREGDLIELLCYCKGADCKRLVKRFACKSAYKS